MPETISQASIYLLQGDDELTVKDYLKTLAASIKGQSQADLDREHLDGSNVARSTITQALNAMSLFSPRRMVVLEQALDALKDKDARAWLEDTLKQLPESCVLVLLIEDRQRYIKGEMQWEIMGKKHWLRESLANCGREFAWVEMALPNQREMPAWIMAEVERQGGKFEGQAAAELANLVGNNLFQVRQEISKALSYVGPQGTVTRADVRLLCSQSREEDIFAMLDAVGTRDGRTALGLLQHLQQDLPAQQIFSMLARQVRLLIMAREVLDSGGSHEELISKARLNPFVAKKAYAQCRQFSLPELEGLYQRLDRMDEESKTGEATLEVAMESIIAHISIKPTL